jgi:nicotinate-nucleotide adenylyltransferase
VTIIPGQRSATVQATLFMRVAIVSHHAALQSTGQDCASRRVTDRLKIRHLTFPLRLHYARYGAHASCRSMKRIGLLGGSFNPAHPGHRRISLAAMDALGLDEVWWLVSPGNPLKANAKDMASFEDRFASAQAVARRSRIRVSDFERREGTRYTIDTVRKLALRYPNVRFIWLMGADTVAEFHQWKHWRKLAESLPIAVIHRPGYDRKAHAARAMGWLRRFVRPSSQAEKWTDWSAPAILFLRLPPDPTSATGLRAHDPNWHERFADPEPGSKRFALPTSVRRALARPSH